LLRATWSLTFHDEVDEAKDGCGGVVWQPYVLKKAHTSNKLLHELAREIRGVEKRRNRKLNGTQYKAIFAKWELASKPFLRPGDDYFTALLAKLDCVTVPKGETLLTAFERAQQTEPPASLWMSPTRDCDCWEVYAGNFKKWPGSNRSCSIK
jgi:hypothetical protein